MKSVRRLTETHLEAVWELEKNCFPENFYSKKQVLEMMKNERYCFWGIWKDKKIVGYIILFDSVDLLEIIKTGISPEYRRKGLGEKMLKDIFFQLEMSIQLEVRERNISAIELYKKIGFKNLFVRKGYYRDTGEDALVMVLDK